MTVSSEKSPQDQHECSGEYRNYCCQCTQMEFIDCDVILGLWCNTTCVTPSMNRPLVVWDISVRFREFVQRTSEDGLYLLFLSSVILQSETEVCLKTTSVGVGENAAYTLLLRFWLTSAVVQEPKPTLRRTTGGFSPLSRGKACGSFPVSSCGGHSLTLNKWDPSTECASS